MIFCEVYGSSSSILYTYPELKKNSEISQAQDENKNYFIDISKDNSNTLNSTLKLTNRILMLTVIFLFLILLSYFLIFRFKFVEIDHTFQKRMEVSDQIRQTALIILLIGFLIELIILIIIVSKKNWFHVTLMIMIVIISLFSLIFIALEFKYISDQIHYDISFLITLFFVGMFADDSIKN